MRLRRLPKLELPGWGWKQVTTRIHVEPVTAHRERWDWRVELLYDGRPNPMMYERATRRHPAPGCVGGRCRNEGDAWAEARAVVDDFRARYAAEQLRQGQARAQEVPL